MKSSLTAASPQTWRPGPCRPLTSTMPCTSLRRRNNSMRPRPRRIACVSSSRHTSRSHRIDTRAAPQAFWDRCAPWGSCFRASPRHPSSSPRFPSPPWPARSGRTSTSSPIRWQPRVCTPGNCSSAASARPTAWPLLSRFWGSTARRHRRAGRAWLRLLRSSDCSRQG